MDILVPSLLICESTARFLCPYFCMSIHNLQEFHKNVMAKAEVIQLVGDAITNFTEVQCLTPRYLSYKVLFLGSICVVRVISYCFSGLQTSLTNHLSLLQ